MPYLTSQKILGSCDRASLL